MTEKSIYEQAKVTDKPGEECGVFGMYDFDGSDVSGLSLIHIPSPRDGLLSSMPSSS